MEKISWADRVKIVVVRRIKEEMNILHKIKRRKANGIGHILCGKCLKKYIVDGKREGKMEGEGRRGRRLKAYPHITCRSSAMPCHRVFRTCLSHLIYTVRPSLVHTCHAAPMPSPTTPFFSRPRHRMASDGHLVG